MYIQYNPNPQGRNTDDCTVRALTKALNIDWDTAYLKLAMHGLSKADMMEKNFVWGSLLKEYGYQRYIIPNTCPDCYTVEEFCADHPAGMFVVGTGSHVLTVIDGDYYDAWDSGQEVPIFYFWRN